MNTKYIFIDIDSTLLSHKIGIPKSALKAIDQARKNGHKVFVSTGRAASAVDEWIPFFPFDGFLYACGGDIHLDDQVFYQNLIPQEEVLRMIEVFEQAKVGYVLEGSELSYWSEGSIRLFLEPKKAEYAKLPQEVRRHMIREDKMRDIEDYRQSPTPINKFSIFAEDRARFLEAVKQLDASYEVVKYSTSGEVLPKGVDKATGMAKVLEYYQVDPKDSIALGDSMNDYTMLSQAGVGVAMGNAVSALKKVADFVTLPCDEDGIEHAFKHLALID